MPKYTVTIQGETGTPKTVIVDTDGMSANVVESVAAQTAISANANASASASTSQGGKRSSSSFRLKKRRITRKLKKTR